MSAALGKGRFHHQQQHSYPTHLHQPLESMNNWNRDYAQAPRDSSHRADPSNSSYSDTTLPNISNYGLPPSSWGAPSSSSSSANTSQLASTLDTSSDSVEPYSSSTGYRRSNESTNLPTGTHKNYVSSGLASSYGSGPALGAAFSTHAASYQQRLPSPHYVQASVKTPMTVSSNLPDQMSSAHHTLQNRETRPDTTVLQNHYAYGNPSSSAQPQQQQHHQQQQPQQFHHNHHYSQPVDDYLDFRTQYLNPFEVKHRRRTTRMQFKVLETTFKENPKPNASTRKTLSQQLDMPVRAVQIWFQNRRAKAKTVARKEANQTLDVDEENDKGEDECYQHDNPDHAMSRPSTSAGLEDVLDGDEDGDSASPPSPFRPPAAEAGHSSHRTWISTSYPSDAAPVHSDAFKVPHRPLKVEREASSSSRRMTLDSMPTAHTSTNNAINYATTNDNSTSYHSSPFQAGGTMSFTSHPSHHSASTAYYDGYSRPASSSSISNSYDDRHRRPTMASSSSDHQDSTQASFPTLNSYRFNSAAHGIDMQLPHAYNGADLRRLPTSSDIGSSGQGQVDAVRDLSTSQYAHYSLQDSHNAGQSHEGVQSNDWRY
ncbi:hypothetical protein CBS101457_001345 [Exobasidium rhododendri]|nr:hypothetical protein CBS101457_001345 [Exobasidium rhododendri]